MMEIMPGNNDNNKNNNATGAGRRRLGGDVLRSPAQGVPRKGGMIWKLKAANDPWKWLKSGACRKGGWYGWKPSSSFNFWIRAFRACPIVETRQAAPSRAIRGNSISVNSTLPTLTDQDADRLLHVMLSLIKIYQSIQAAINITHYYSTVPSPPLRRKTETPKRRVGWKRRSGKRETW